MQLAKKLREGVRRGDITCSVRIWKQPRVKVGGRYALEAGEIEVDRVRSITLEDITPELARRSGFEGVDDLMKTARHGSGDHIFLVEFHYIEFGR